MFNWSEESDGLNPGGTRGYAEAAADALYAALRDPSLPPGFAGTSLLDGPVHFIGHSRGAVVNSDCVERLAAAGIAVDQVTSLDPHPVDGTLDYPLDLADWGDRSPVTWNNVDFADNYWRADGGGIPAASDFDGVPIGADVDLDLGAGIEGPFDVDPVFEHSEVHAWYHGTVDLAANDDGDGIPIDDELLTDWYGSGGIPARDATGFHFSAIGQGTRPAAQPGAAPAWSTFSIYNGDFEIVDSEPPTLGVGYAGWLYHGGDKSGVLLPWSAADPPPGSTWYLTLFGDGDGRTLTHNRLFVDTEVTGVEFAHRVAVASPNDRLEIALVSDTEQHTVVDLALASTSSWQTLAFPIAASERGRTFALRLSIEGAGDGVEAVVDVDDIRFLPEPAGGRSLAAGVVILLLLDRRKRRWTAAGEAG